MSLHDIEYRADGLRYEDHRQRLGDVPLEQFLADAATIVRDRASSRPDPLPPPETTADFEHLRWFPYPAEV